MMRSTRRTSQVSDTPLFSPLLLVQLTNSLSEYDSDFEDYDDDGPQVINQRMKIVSNVRGEWPRGWMAQRSCVPTIRYSQIWNKRGEQGTGWLTQCRRG